MGSWVAVGDLEVSFAASFFDSSRPADRKDGDSIRTLDSATTPARGAHSRARLMVTFSLQDGSEQSFAVFLQTIHNVGWIVSLPIADNNALLTTAVLSSCNLPCHNYSVR